MTKRFSDFGIKSPVQMFTGDKIRIQRILNREIQVHDFRIEPSKFGDTSKCLYLQIEMDGTRYVVFTGSNTLMELIQQVPRAGFPFATTIVQEEQRFEFT